MLLVDQRRDSEAGRLGRVRRSGTDLLDGVGDRVQQRLLLEPGHRALRAVMDLLLGVDRAGKHLGPAEVDADNAVRRHVGHHTRSHG